MNLISALPTKHIKKQQNDSIRLQDVKDYLNKRGEIQVKSKPGGSNSFVSPGAKFEFEIDIMDTLARDGGEGIRYGMVANYF